MTSASSLNLSISKNSSNNTHTYSFWFIYCIVFGIFLANIKEINKNLVSFGIQFGVRFGIQRLQTSGNADSAAAAAAAAAAITVQLCCVVSVSSRSAPLPTSGRANEVSRPVPNGLCCCAKRTLLCVCVCGRGRNGREDGRGDKTGREREIGTPSQKQGSKQASRLGLSPSIHSI